MYCNANQTVTTPALKTTYLCEMEVLDYTKAHPCNLSEGVVQPNEVLKMLGKQISSSLPYLHLNIAWDIMRQSQHSPAQTEQHKTAHNQDRIGKTGHKMTRWEETREQIRCRWDKKMGNIGNRQDEKRGEKWYWTKEKTRRRVEDKIRSRWQEYIKRVRGDVMSNEETK